MLQCIIALLLKKNKTLWNKIELLLSIIYDHFISHSINSKYRLFQSMFIVNFNMICEIRFHDQI